MSAVKLFDIRWVSHTAGPSPVMTKFGPNARIELFFMGCKKAEEGNPCDGCFNPTLWKTIKGARELNPVEMAEHLEKFAPQKYITIVGGEPFDNPEGLTVLCEELRKRDFHIIVFTHYTLKNTFKRWKKYGMRPAILVPGRGAKVPETIEGWTQDLFIRFLKSIDILIDGEYEKANRIYDESFEDGFRDAIGSSNQIVWDLRSWRESEFSTSIYGQCAENIMQLSIREKDNSLVFLIKRNSFEVFPLVLKESEYTKEKHTRWYVSSFDIRTHAEDDDFYHYYYLLRYKDYEKSAQDARADIKRDIVSYGASHDISDNVVRTLCDSVDDPNFFDYNEPWLNVIARYHDKDIYESELIAIKEAYC